MIERGASNSVRSSRSDDSGTDPNRFWLWYIVKWIRSKINKKMNEKERKAERKQKNERAVSVMIKIVEKSNHHCWTGEQQKRWGCHRIVPLSMLVLYECIGCDCTLPLPILLLRGNALLLLFGKVKISESV